MKNERINMLEKTIVSQAKNILKLQEIIDMQSKQHAEQISQLQSSLANDEREILLLRNAVKTNCELIQELSLCMDKIIDHIEGTTSSEETAEEKGED